MYQLTEIVELVKEQTGNDEVFENTDIVNDLGCYGDDFDELMEKFAKDYHVDMSSYRWYFHAAEEGSRNSIGGAFFKAPNERVERIPVTPAMLLGFARTGKWDIEYPDHKLPKRRYDLIINQVVLVVFIVFLIYKCTSK